MHLVDNKNTKDTRKKDLKLYLKKRIDNVKGIKGACDKVAYGHYNIGI